MGAVVDVIVIVPDAVRIVVCWPANNGCLCRTIGATDGAEGDEPMMALFVDTFCNITFGNGKFWALEFC